MMSCVVKINSKKETIFLKNLDSIEDRRNLHQNHKNLSKICGQNINETQILSFLIEKLIKYNYKATFLRL
jgi:hypothetical protein